TRSKRDWSSDVCSSDLGGFGSCRESMVHVSKGFGGLREPLRLSIRLCEQQHEARTLLDLRLSRQDLDCALGLAGLKEGLSQQRKIGRASCREREERTGV